MTVPPSPAEILAALADSNSNAITDRIAAAVTRYSAMLWHEVGRRGGWPEILRLPKPRDEIESLAFELFRAQLRESVPAMCVEIKDD
jgi:hypothetical protein